MSGKPDTSRIPFQTVGTRLSTEDAQTVEAVLLDAMRSNERMSTEETKRVLIEHARPKESPTHHLFEWDPLKQQDLYLLERAGQIIRDIHVVRVGQSDTRMRRFPVVVFGGKRGPYPIEAVLKSKNLTGQLLEQATAEILAWTKRYNTLRDMAELKGVFEAVEKLKAPKRGDEPGPII